MAGSGAARHDRMALPLRSFRRGTAAAVPPAKRRHGAFPASDRGELRFDLRRMRGAVAPPSAPGTHCVRRGAARVGSHRSFRHAGALGDTASSGDVYDALCRRGKAMGGASGCRRVRRGAPRFCADVPAAAVHPGGRAVSLSVRAAHGGVFLGGLLSASAVAGLFFAAAAAAKRLEELPPEEKFTPAPRFFAWLSRRSLAVYLLHQPVLLAVTALLESATRGT